MAPIDIGGDTSIKWKVDLRNAREAYSDPLPQPAPRAGKRYYHEGVDVKATRAFIVTIKVPQRAVTRKKFLAALKTFVKAPQSALTLKLDIEDDRHGGPNEDQIHIDW